MRLGDETEIMNLQAYNGMLYGGTLPHAQLYRCDGDGDWQPSATLSNAFEFDEQVQAAAGIYWDRPAGMPKPEPYTQRMPVARSRASRSRR